MKEVVNAVTGPGSGPDQLTGRIIAGKYCLEQYIGRGSSGAVYRARHSVLEKPIALKILDPDLARSAEVVELFKREAKAASRLDHVNSVRILDFGSDADGPLYIAMELVEGPDLLQLLDEQFPLEHDRIIEIMSQILSALAQAHELGVIHRDLKPENVLLLRGRADDGKPTDVVKVCDFGVAQLSPIPVPAVPLPRTDSGRASAIDANMLVGTPEYMSPEQARGEPLDPRSDIYAAGMVLFQLLTGLLPFTGDNAGDVALMQCNEPLPRPSSFAFVPAPLEAVCLKALNKDPGERYQSAREMRAALRRVSQARRTQTLPLPRGLKQPVVVSTPNPDTMSPPPDVPVREPEQPVRPKRRLAAIALLVPALAAGSYLATRGGAVDQAAPPAAAAAQLPSAATVASAAERPGFTSLADSVVQTTAQPPAQPAEVPTKRAARVSDPRLRRRASAAAPADTTQVSIAPAASAQATPEPSTAMGESAIAAADPELGGEFASDDDISEVALGALPTREAAPVASKTDLALNAAPAPKPARYVSEPLRAKVRIADVTVRGSVATSVVTRAIARVRSRFGACYGESAEAAGRNGFGQVLVEVEFDEYGRARKPRADGAVLSGLDRCIAEVASKLVTSTAPDTGTVKASWRVIFAR